MVESFDDDLFPGSVTFYAPGTGSEIHGDIGTDLLHQADEIDPETDDEADDEPLRSEYL